MFFPVWLSSSKQQKQILGLTFFAPSVQMKHESGEKNNKPHLPKFSASKSSNMIAFLNKMKEGKACLVNRAQHHLSGITWVPDYTPINK